jgi:hypothetical protein
VTSDQATDLLHLRCMWQQAYAISLSDGIWTAQRHDDPTCVLTADTAPDLRWQIRTDYGAWLRTSS